MADDATKPVPGSAEIQVLKVPDKPGLTLIRLEGTSLEGEPFSAGAVFDTVLLARQIFGPMFNAALDDLLTAATLRFDLLKQAPATVADLKVLNDLISPNTDSGLDQLTDLHEFITRRSKSAVTQLASIVRAYGEIAVVNALDRLGGVHEAALTAEARAPAPAPAKAERAAPPPAETALRADGASSSNAAPQGDGKRPKHVNGLAAA